MSLERALAVGLMGVTLSLVASAASAQTEPTLALEPESGTPGTIIELSGQGYPDDPLDITVEWGFQGELMEASPEINNGILTGTAMVPDDAVEGVSRVRVCVSYYPEFDDIPTTDCAFDQLFVIPLIAVTPETGTPGTPFELASSSFEGDNPSQWEVRWGAEDGSVIGSVLVDQDGVLTGGLTVPRNAAEGPSTIEVCRQDIDLGSVCYSVKPSFEVRHPNVTANPPQLQPGEPFEVTGEEWCCPGELGDVSDTRTGEVWGEVFVDASRTLIGNALVPEGTEPGDRPVEVCVAELCRPLVITVMPPPTTTTVPPGVCGGSLRVDPSSGLPGSSVRVTMTGAEGSPDGCLVTLELDGRQIGGLELIPGDESTTDAVVPGDITPGPTDLVAFDADDGRALDSTFFIVAGLPPEGGFPWIWVAAVAAGLLMLLGLVRALMGRPPTTEPRREPEQPTATLPVVPARWLEARLYARSSAETPVAYFRAGASHRIEVSVGAADLAQEEVTPQTLRVVLTEPRLLAAPQTAAVMIRDNGPSSSASLTLDVPDDTASVDARLLLVKGDRVVQTARLPQMVGSPPAGQPSNVAKVETVVRAVTIPASNRVSTALVVDGGRFPTITQVSTSQQPRLMRLPDTGADAVERIRHRLGEIVEAPDDFAGLERELTRKLLVYLANQGRLLRSALVTDFLGEALAANPSLQVVSVAPDAYLPLELAYDHPAPREDAAVCPRAGDTLRSLDLLAPCPGPHDDTVVCPVGFWGSSKVIERHAFQSRDDLPDGFLVTAQPISGRQRIELSSGVLVGPSNRVDAYDPNTIARLRDRLQETGTTATFVDSWVAWDQEVASSGPALLVLLPHTIYSNELELPGLEIGASDRRWASAIGDGRMVPQTPVIVLLLGCETAVAGAVSYERFPGNLRRAGASIVVATLTDVLGRHAAPLAERLVTLTLANTSGPVRLGEVMVRLRRQLLAEGLPVVLALAVFGDADWLVGGS